ncbi:MAG: FtsQ-type POTRA domain-containing protein [Flaviflexus sp.]|nr:FtsQ-type POTRA domain-containing protein [Flaviflexus sp.]
MRPPKQPKRPAAMRQPARQPRPAPAEESIERSLRRATPPRSAQTAAEPEEVADPRQARRTRQPVRLSPRGAVPGGGDTAPTAPVPAEPVEEPRATPDSPRSAWLSRLGFFKPAADRRARSEATTEGSPRPDGRASATSSAKPPAPAPDPTSGRSVAKAKKRPGRKASSQPLDLEAARRDMKAARRSRRIRKIGLILAVLAVLAAMTYILFFSPLLAVKKDKISVETTDPARVLPLGSIDAITGPYVGRPVLSIDTEAVEDLIEELPEVSSAHVHRSLPSGLTVEVTGRIPVACLTEAEQCTPIDTEGVKLPGAQGAEELPNITGDPTGISDLLDVMAVLPEGVRSRVTTANISETGLIEFDLGGPVVKWGASVDNEKKAQVLEVLLSQEANIYDVSIPTAPVTS